MFYSIDFTQNLKVDKYTENFKYFSQILLNS